MGTRGKYFGYGLSGVDDKGRVSVPARLRSTLEANSSGRTLYVSRHPVAPCLMAYDRLFHEELPDFLLRLAEEEGQGKERKPTQSELARAAGVSDELPFDGSGRFVLPPFMRRTGKIETKALFVGALDIVEIWNPEIALTADCVPAATREVAEFLLEGGK